MCSICFYRLRCLIIAYNCILRHFYLVPIFNAFLEALHWLILTIKNTRFFWVHTIFK